MIYAQRLLVFLLNAIMMMYAPACTEAAVVGAGTVHTHIDGSPLQGNRITRSKAKHRDQRPFTVTSDGEALPVHDGRSGGHLFFRQSNQITLEGKALPVHDRSSGRHLLMRQSDAIASEGEVMPAQGDA